MKSLNIFCRRCYCFFPLLYLGCSLDLARYSNIMPHWETLSGWIVLYCNVFRICCRMNNINQRKYMSLPIWKSKFPPQLENKSKFLAHLKSPFSSMKRKAPSMGNKKKWLMFCLLFLTPCSRTAMAIAGFKVNQSNFGQTSLSSQSWVVTSNQSVQNGRTVQNYLVSWKKECIQHHLRLIVFVL